MWEPLGQLDSPTAADLNKNRDAYQRCGATKVSLTVVNRCGTTALRIRWHDQTGKPIFRGALGPRKQRTLESYSGHTWSLAATSGSRCLGGYRLSRADNVIVYDDRAAAKGGSPVPR